MQLVVFIRRFLYSSLKIGWCHKKLYQYQEMFNPYYLAKVYENTLDLIFNMDIV